MESLYHCQLDRGIYLFIYRPGDFFFQKIHPVALTFYIFALFLIFIISNHPILLSFTVFITLLSAISVGGSEDVKNGMGFILRMTLFFMLINCLTNKSGRTVIWRGPTIPIFGRLQISFETLIYALVMGIRLSGVYILFIFYNKAMSPDAALSYVALLFPKSALLVSMTTKTIPYLAQLSERVGQVMYVMGLDIKDGSYKDRVKERMPILKVLFMSSIEDSFSIAESIQARGYGSEKRSHYFIHRWNIRDLIVMFSSIAGILGFIVLCKAGGVFYIFYPRLDGLTESIENMEIFIGVMVLLSIPALMGWGWRHWRYLKYKI